MTIYYDADSDYIELFFKTARNYGDEISDCIMVFKDEVTDEVIGYAFENASVSLFNVNEISTQAKLAVILKMARVQRGLTQNQAAEIIQKITTRQYQRLESGEENTTLSTLEAVMRAFPEHDFSKLFKKVS